MTNNIKRRTFLGGAAGAGLALTATGLVSANGETRYAVRVSEDAAADRVERAGYEIENELAAGRILLVVGPADSKDELEDVSGVEVAVPDFRIELEEPVGQDEDGETEEKPRYWDLQWDKDLTDVDRAHDVATGDGSTIAVIDTGIDDTHPDLQNINTEKSYSVFDGEFGPHDGDYYGHGTHVAGIAAGTGAEGVLGTAPDAELVSLRVFGGDHGDAGFWSDLLLAIEYAANEGVDAANMSIGTIYTLPPQVNAGGIRGVMEPVMQRATQKGLVIVASAGNHGESLQQEGYFTLPNSLAGVMSVSATGPNDELTFYSNWGTNEIDVGAPGGGYETLEKTLSTDVPWPFPTNLVYNAMAPDSLIGQELGGVRYAYLAGTSMAAPQVTGTAALVREARPDSTAQQVEVAIEEGADLVDGRGDEELGAGRLNAYDALD